MGRHPERSEGPGWVGQRAAPASRSLATLGMTLEPVLRWRTEIMRLKDLPAGHGYIDHAFLGYNAMIGAGFLPERRISCPMDGAYLPQDVRRARLDGRLLGQVRDLIVARKPLSPK